MSSVDLNNQELPKKLVANSGIKIGEELTDELKRRISHHSFNTLRLIQSNSTKAKRQVSTNSNPSTDPKEPLLLIVGGSEVPQTETRFKTAR